MRWTTKFRFRAGVDVRLPCIALLAVALGISGCTESYGTAADGFLTAQIGQAYLPLKKSNLFASRDGAAVVIAPGIAVTNAHNANIVDASSLIGKSAAYDLLYFRTDKELSLPVAAPVDGEAVVAYGEGKDGLRMSRGVVRKFWPAAFGYVSDAGPGFSGGPVVDVQTGKLVGITYGYIDDIDPKKRLMVAYTMAFVASEYASLKPGADALSGSINR